MWNGIYGPRAHSRVSAARTYRARAGAARIGRQAGESRAAVGGDALDAASVRTAMGDADVLVHLVGVAHPSPAKAREFREIDLRSIAASVAARPRYLIYVSVAHPAPAMKSYVAVRMEGEELIRKARLNATIVRPWYVLGPGHWWPLALVPIYWVLERIPATREGARRLGLVTLRQMTMALADAVDRRTTGARVVDVPAIRAGVSPHP
jgi:uncharacterized protein YbjT (DUF2867 family)